MYLCSPLTLFFSFFVFFFFNDTATTEIYTLSLHDALPISDPPRLHDPGHQHAQQPGVPALPARGLDRKSTRLNSSHQIISYAVFCLKKKKKTKQTIKTITPETHDASSNLNPHDLNTYETFH